jgi:vacuolar-type H+-ATPase subunit F/Vma7
MSEVVALGEPGDLAALLAAGVTVTPCASAEELGDRLAELAVSEEVGLVLVAEPVATLDMDAVDEARQRHDLVVLVIPTLGSQAQVSEKALSRLLEEAAGADLLAREAEAAETE